MTARSKTQSTILAAVAVALMTAVLSGCSNTGDTAPAGSSAGQAPTAPQGETTGAPSSTPDADNGFPSCDEVKAALGPEVAGLIELEGSENGVSTGSMGPELGCVWYTPETNASNIEIGEYGGISVGVSRDPSYTQESMEPLGWMIQDARVSGAGAWALKPGGQYDPAAQLDVAGMQVVRDGTVVVFTSLAWHCRRCRSLRR
ncbi:hypothetical protein SAMN06295879_2065 [Agreia bicolorata]|uniref:DUF3558 domain-containing protein n=1 Tax=Agreia bicolorata TaxID=110935 RepID=A0A1T4Y1L8_9MICO|nr:hypothetical protein [Agreia bicolorata]SKA95704.1 hypothetical protein SAMN06295879_2065 [Agreia bicolorata]